MAPERRVDKDDIRGLFAAGVKVIKDGGITSFDLGELDLCSISNNSLLSHGGCIHLPAPVGLVLEFLRHSFRMVGYGEELVFQPGGVDAM